MKFPSAGSVFSVEDFDRLGFHDCYVHGIKWEAYPPTLTLCLDYIANWIEKEGRYEFLGAKSEVRFNYVRCVSISIDWQNMPMECQIQDIHQEAVPPSQARNKSYQWKILFNVPSGYIAFESPCFELEILTDPKRSSTQHLK